MNKKAVPAIAFLFLIMGALGLFRHSDEVRTVVAVGLFASGMACGAALVVLVIFFRKST